ncbi:cupin domain-containing protein [Williamsia sp. CHRR-6]|uniref:cupin domain-containing protein n=1 Tax=Williamsia sp. CHRR-6 TaxID=2835871 RepID=UPI001BDA43A0|nr:cupin domain-containing protein [Williamsia sp. CHRR-6]MBT0565484.1 cupin domain-containing protein [Williamsia sp. CHRR-6]
MSELPDWATGLDLQPHPEGGWYRETWASDIVLPESVLPQGYSGERKAGTAILFVLPAGAESAWHTVRGAEIWLHHRGGPVELTLGGDGSAPGHETTVELGPDILAGQRPQHVVGAQVWQRARATEEAALVSCIVVPGFDFADFALL